MPGGTVFTPPRQVEAGTVPDVRGLGIREATVTIEKAGYNVKFEGLGYVASQSPEPGTRAAAGTKVSVILRQD